VPEWFAKNETCEKCNLFGASPCAAAYAVFNIHNDRMDEAHWFTSTAEADRLLAFTGNLLLAIVTAACASPLSACVHTACVHSPPVVFRMSVYHRVPKFSPYGSVCCACAEVTKNIIFFSMGLKLVYPGGIYLQQCSCCVFRLSYRRLSVQE
jgi:hypothetical protein